MEEFQRYCWNPDTGQMLGRTLSRWGPCMGPGRGQGPPRGCEGLAVPGPQERAGAAPCGEGSRSWGPDKAPPASRPRRPTPKACPGPDTLDPGHSRAGGS